MGIHVTQLLVGRAGREIRLELDGKRRAWDALERLLLRAEPDRTVVSETAAPFLDRRFVLARLPEPAGDGRVLPARRRRARQPRGGPPAHALAGRGHELELLRDRLAIAAEGRGQVVGIVGEAGIGKSRLLVELKRSLRGERIAWFEGHCLSYGSAVPYLPVITILRRSFHIGESDTPATMARKVRSGLEELGMDPEEWAVYLHHLLGVKEEAERLSVLTPRPSGRGPWTRSGRWDSGAAGSVRSCSPARTFTGSTARPRSASTRCSKPRPAPPSSRSSRTGPATGRRG